MRYTCRTIGGMTNSIEDVPLFKVKLQDKDVNDNIMTFENKSNGGFAPSTISLPICQYILYDDIVDNSRVRIWDLIILIPNVVFLLFLLWKLKTAITKLRTSNSPMFTAFYILVSLVAIISVLRCVVSMTVNVALKPGALADKLLWLILRFFLLATEMSIIIFGLAFGHLDSRRSIQWVLLVTSCIAFLYSITQGTFEIIYPDPHFSKKASNNTSEVSYDVFGHGGMIFWLTSSLFFFVVYLTIFILPWTSLKEKLSLPPKKSFYRYAAFLAILNLLQAVGSALIYSDILKGFCVIDVTTYIYFTCFAPIVYLVFLRKFFATTQAGILFSYKNQVDDVADTEDTVNMPYQAASISRTEDSDSFVGSYDSTHFDRHPQSHPKSLLSNSSIQFGPGGSLNSNSHDFYQASA